MKDIPPLDTQAVRQCLTEYRNVLWLEREPGVRYDKPYGPASTVRCLLDALDEIDRLRAELVAKESRE